MGVWVDSGAGMCCQSRSWLGVSAGSGLYNVLLDKYASLSFILEDGSLNLTTIVSYTTDLLALYGLKDNRWNSECCRNNNISKEYFNPLNDNTGKLRNHPNTLSIHWYSKTWLKSTLGVWSYRGWLIATLATTFPRYFRKILRIKMTPRISVIIWAFTIVLSDFLVEALDSLLAQTCQDFKVIMCDDARMIIRLRLRKHTSIGIPVNLFLLRMCKIWN